MADNFPHLGADIELTECALCDGSGDCPQCQGYNGDQECDFCDNERACPACCGRGLKET